MDALTNPKTELAIIGVAMEDMGCAINLAGLPEDMFSQAETQALHRAIKRLVKKNQQPEMLTLINEAKTDLESPEQIILEAMTTGIGAAFYGQYEGILNECRKRRILFGMANEIIKTVPDCSASVDALAANSIKALQGADMMTSSLSAQEALMEFINSLDRAKVGRCTTGIADLDRLTGGFRGGKLVVLGARPGVGKTALALCMAVHVARHAGPVLIVSLEMDAAEVMSRIVAAESGVDVQKIESGELTDDEIRRTAQCYGEVGSLPLRITTKATTPLQVRREAVSMKNKQGLAMVVVDYIQLMRGDGKHNSRYEEVSAISRELKLMAMDLGVPVLALTQFNRDSEKATNGKAEKRAPTMAEAKDSGSIEQDANLFMIQYEPPEPAYEPGGAKWESWASCKANGTTWQTLSIAKNRQGRTGVINMAFDKPHMKFASIDLQR